VPTIGVAVPIPEPWARELQDYRTAVGDETAAKIPTHITLVPPLDVDDTAMVDIAKHLEEVARSSPAYRIHLRGTGTFRPISPVVFVSLAVGISQSEQLASAVRRGPLATTLEFPYHPHVTIAHHLDDEALDRAFAELSDFECVFIADAFHLYVHDDVVGWQPTRAFELSPRPDLEE
jgi:2'-5' RNA ligase